MSPASSAISASLSPRNSRPRPGTKLIEVPNAIADQLHMRHGWTVLNDEVIKLFTKNGVAYEAFNQVTAILNIPAMFIVALVTALLVVGIKESARVNDVIVMIKVAIVVTFIIVGLPMINPRELGRQVHPGEYRVVPLRVERDLPRRGAGLLRLYRLRRGLDRRPGGQESPARHADRDHRLADHLHDPLLPRRDRHDRSGQLQAARRPRSGRGGDRRHGTPVAHGHREARCDRRASAR